MNIQQLKEILHQSPESFSPIFWQDFVLPQLLGDKHPELAYWLGKEIAQKLTTNTLTDITDFFAAVQWGSLSLVTQKKNHLMFSLTGDEVTRRPQTEAAFKLQAGFIAQALSSHYQVMVEAAPHIAHHQVTLEAVLDEQDPLN